MLHQVRGCQSSNSFARIDYVGFLNSRTLFDHLHQFLGICDLFKKKKLNETKKIDEVEMRKNKGWRFGQWITSCCP